MHSHWIFHQCPFFFPDPPKHLGMSDPWYSSLWFTCVGYAQQMLDPRLLSTYNAFELPTHDHLCTCAELQPSLSPLDQRSLQVESISYCCLFCVEVETTQQSNFQEHMLSKKNENGEELPWTKGHTL